MTCTPPKIYRLKQALSLGLIMWGTLACREVTETRSTPLSLNLEACLDHLSFDRPEQSCAQEVGAAPRGCFLIRSDEGGSASMPVQWTLERSLEVADEHSAQLLTSINSLDEEPTEGALVFFGEGASFDCRDLTLEESCEGDCVVKVNFLLREEGEGKGKIVMGIPEADEQGLCAWRLPDPNTEERCDGLDNDCDGEVDESPEHTVGAECHNGELGQCRVEGIKGCDEAGGWVCLYETDEVIEPEDERCDGLDNDCDGELDESFPEQGQACERGEGLSIMGVRICQEGQLLCSAEERCDEVDNDLDGVVDEGFELGEACMPEELSCYSRTGQIKCVTPERLSLRIGELGEAACFPDEITRLEEGPEDCDGLDNDCDGFTDEGFLEQVISCGDGVCENTNGRLRCIEGETVDDCAPLPETGIDDDCNGQDNDCDGLVDEGFISYSMPCEGLVGECSRQTQVFCVNRQQQYSCPEVTPPQEEDLRCDGLDEDCDGLVDESFVAKEVSCGLGVCAQTVWSTCEAGVELRSCTPGEPLGVDDTCDGVDDDCDGRSDEGYTPQPYDCFVGECQQSFMTRCINQDGSVEELSSCPEASLILPQAEVCDGLDNDCDGVVDDEIAEQPTSCGLGICAATGSISCTEGELIDSCSPSLPVEGVADDCDGLDNDCDGRVDEDFVSEDYPCNSELCLITGFTFCANGVVSNTCSAEIDVNDPDNTCDGVDQDCDGELDEGVAEIQTSCGRGSCSSTGVSYCESGLVRDSCVPGEPTLDTSCDGIDQDCDGAADEGFVVTGVSCGKGVCVGFGVKTCFNGVISDNCEIKNPTGPDDDCDLLDNDCDGFVDEGYLSQPITCGNGACRNTGTQFCGATGVIESCIPLNSVSPDTSCDGVDQDCDGVVDEGFVGVLVTCGQGECVRSARKECQEGQIVDVCEPSEPSGSDNSCNQLDEDCDGTLDEGFVGDFEDCGPGSCEPSAQQLCTQSGVQSTCSYQTSPTDETCNGVDEDCDGLVDEDYVSPPTDSVCGVGACQRQGSIACLNGSPQVVCDPGAPVTDDDCNGVDDDCDGAVDEGFTVTYECGQGVCARSVTGGCELVAEDCVPGVAGDELCGDGLNNDCDDSVDEGFESLGDSCTVGLGVCAQEGQLRCRPQDPSAPLECDTLPLEGSAELCDSLDNDCDGAVDEHSDQEPLIGAAGEVVGVDCERDGYEETLCFEGLWACQGGQFTCAGIEPGQVAEDYCTNIDEDCDPNTPPRVYEEFVTEDVPFGNLGETYSIQLKEVCGEKENGDECKWECKGEVLRCKKGGTDCEPY